MQSFLSPLFVHFKTFKWFREGHSILMLLSLRIQNYVVRGDNVEIESTAVYRRGEPSQIKLVKKATSSSEKYVSRVLVAFIFQLELRYFP